MRETLRFLHVCKTVELADWLLDMMWLEWKDPENYLVAAVTAHNVFCKHEVVRGELVSTHYRNEVSCILYPGCRILLAVAEQLWRIVLTVFKDILL